MARKRGGYQRPSKPAAASGPGALSARTDGAVPALQRTGEKYGENQAVNQQQASAPISQGGGGLAPASPQGLPPGMGSSGVFSPTSRPGEPLTAGVDAGPGEGRPKPMLPPDPYMVARALYRLSPTPELERLIARLGG